MWWRGIIGVVLCAAGIVWIGQGIGAIHGSFMTGRSQYTVLGVVTLVVGIVMIAWAWRHASHHTDEG
jgi:hypothetical protein